MLLLHEATYTILAEEGQVLVPLKALNFDKLTLERIFTSVAKKYQNKKPIRDKMIVNISPEGVELPNVRNILAVRPHIYNNFDKIAAPLERNMWDWNANTRMLRSLLSYQVEITYIGDLTIAQLPVAYKGPYFSTNEGTIEFFLRGDFKSNSLKITKNGLFVKDSGMEAGLVKLAGSLGYGNVDPETLKVTLTITDPTPGNLDINFFSKYNAVKELNLDNLVFMTWYGAELLKAVGTAKKITMIEGLPLDITADGIMERARELQDKLEELLSQKSDWWNFGY